jgi:hypothetical protein
MRKLRRANEYFGLTEEEFRKTGAFNPLIGVDNEFFVDPLLLPNTNAPELKDGLKRVREYFEQVVTLLRYNDSKTDKEALKRLIIREVKGLGIGYGKSSDDGSAIGPELAYRIFTTAKELMKLGIQDPAIFELMGVYEKDFGPDRLSDTIIFINKDFFCQYTVRIAKELGLKTPYEISGYEKKYLIPKHPLADKPFIFIPEDILRSLPVVADFDQISAAATFNDELRQRFNRLIAPCFLGNKKPKKNDIREFILATKERVVTLLEVYQKCNPTKYDFDKDPEGLYRWLEKASDFVEANPLVFPQEIDTIADVDTVVQKILSTFKKFIEVKGGWRGLYNNKMEILNERHARLFFYATALTYCESLNVDVSPESSAGRGPVDFKLSRGNEKIVVEVKLTSGNVKQGYEKQTRLYEQSEDAQKSYFLVLQVTESSEALKVILELEKTEEASHSKHPIIVPIDARRKESASTT